MRIGTPVLEFEDGHTTWSVAVDGLDGAPDRLWYRLPDQHAGMLTERADPAVIGLLIPAMHSGDPMTIEGPVTDELVHNLTHGYQHILETVAPDLNRVALETADPVPAAQPASGVGTGFSAGIDSFAVLAEHHFSPVPNDLRLSHLTLFNVGSHSPDPEVGRRRFIALHDLLAPVADGMGLPLIPVDSNLDDFYGFTDFQQTHGPRTISAASLLQAGIGRYYIAGAFPYPQLRVERSLGTSRSDPISLPLLATATFRPLSHGSQYTRVEKTLIVADVPVSQMSLNVCVDPSPAGGNCSRCFKCLRTQLTLEIAGRLAQYGNVFDLDVYRKARAAYLFHIATSDDAFAAEIREQAEDAGFRLPSRTMAMARRVALKARRVAHRPVRWIRR
ncbi:hypothetical protein [Agromyces bauzanensis]